MNSKAYQIYSNKTECMTERRNVIFIDTPASTLADSTAGNTTGDAVRTHEDSSQAENKGRHLYHRQRRDKQPPEETVEAHEQEHGHATSAGAEEPAAEGADSNQTLETTRQENCRQATNSEAQHVREHVQVVH